MTSTSDGTGPCAASSTMPCLRMKARAWREVIAMLSTCRPNCYWSRPLDAAHTTPQPSDREAGSCNSTQSLLGRDVSTSRSDAMTTGMPAGVTDGCRTFAANTASTLRHPPRIRLPPRDFISIRYWHAPALRATIHAYRQTYIRSMELVTPSPPRFNTCVQIIVVVTSAWRSHSWTVRMSSLASSRCLPASFHRRARQLAIERAGQDHVLHAKLETLLEPQPGTVEKKRDELADTIRAERRQRRAYGVMARRRCNRFRRAGPRPAARRPESSCEPAGDRRTSASRPRSSG